MWGYILLLRHHLAVMGPDLWTAGPTPAGDGGDGVLLASGAMALLGTAYGARPHRRRHSMARLRSTELPLEGVRAEPLPKDTEQSQ